MHDNSNSTARHAWMHAIVQAANLARLKQRLKDLEKAASASDLWDSQERAQATLQEMADVKGTVEEVEGFQGLLADISTAAELAQLEVRARMQPCVHALIQYMS